MNKIEKPWGFEVLLEENEHYAVKFLTMKEGCRCSLQYHEHKQETIFVLDGILYVELEGKTHRLLRWEHITIRPGQHHRMAAQNGSAAYLETSTPQLDDVVRIEDDYGRTNDTSTKEQSPQ